MLETHIMMNLLIFCLIFLVVLHLIFLMDLTIAHMVLVHNRVMFVPHVGIVFSLEVSILTLS
jgi:hypothetical protein